MIPNEFKCEQTQTKTTLHKQAAASFHPGKKTQHFNPSQMFFRNGFSYKSSYPASLAYGKNTKKQRILATTHLKRSTKKQTPV